MASGLTSVVVTQPRLAIGDLLALAAFSAVACFALRYPSETAATVFFTVVATVLGIATLRALLATPNVRAFYIGFALLGWAYLLVAFCPWFRTSDYADGSGSLLVTSKLLGYVYSRWYGSGGVDRANFEYTCQPLLALFCAVLGGALGRYFDKDQRGGSRR